MRSKREKGSVLKVEQRLQTKYEQATMKRKFVNENDPGSLFFLSFSAYRNGISGRDDVVFPTRYFN